MRLMTLGLVLSITALNAGCVKMSGDFCSVASPIRPSRAAAVAMDDADKRAILKLNEFGAAQCGWRAR